MNVKKVILGTVTATFVLTSSSLTPVFADSTKHAVQTQKQTITTKSKKNTVEKYAKLIGLSKKEIIKVMGEKPNSVDEGGLEFPTTGIRVWFGKDGKTVDQVYITSSNVDFKGAKIGGSIKDFKKSFGKPVQESTTHGYSNFNYNNLVLNVYYDTKTKKVLTVYIMKEWK